MPRRPVSVNQSKRAKQPTRSKAKGVTPSASIDTDRIDGNAVYSGYVVWTSPKRPQWHPVKAMRYVFWRMIDGTTISDALREIHWPASEFWHLIDKRQNDPFRLEYVRAKRLQARAFADSVIAIAEGRDHVTKRSMAESRKLIKKALRRLRKQKNTLGAKALLDSLLAQVDANEHKILGRNKLQIDAAKWVATKMNPAEFGDASRVALSGASDPDGGEGNAASAILIQFVGPNGKVVTP